MDYRAAFITLIFALSACSTADELAIICGIDEWMPDDQLVWYKCQGWVDTPGIITCESDAVEAWVCESAAMHEANASYSVRGKFAHVYECAHNINCVRMPKGGGPPPSWRREPRDEVIFGPAGAGSGDF